MENMGLIIAISILIEALVEYGKKVKDTPVLIVTIILGVIISAIFKTTLFGYFGANIDRTADIVLTGILASRGSNWLNDFIGKFTGQKRVEITEVTINDEEQQ